ncbi:MAG: SDR family NAD(P)-dependent oxidoreductase [Planctomycetia bacterium]|nr:SDR family NAD(P)-dependent oxidoreductase [Planctomycetia bacterium]
MNWRGRKVLVTGAAGFIGSHLAEELVRQGASVKAMIHYDSRPQRSNLELADQNLVQQMEIIAGDVADPHFMFRAVQGCDAVFHLAALIGIPFSYVAPSAYVQTNITGTLNVLEACRLHQTPRLVHTSTSECYGTARYAPIDEQHPLQGQSPYSASKIGADKLVESFFLSFKLPVTTLRPFNTYGPRQSARAVIPTILAQLLSGVSELKLGDASPVRDMNFVEDTVAAFLAVAVSDKCLGEVVNAGTGRGETIATIAELAMKITGRQVPIRVEAQRQRPEGSEVWKLIAANAKAKELAAWSPRVSLELGLEKTAHFIMNHLHLYRPGEYAV